MLLDFSMYYPWMDCWRMIISLKKCQINRILSGKTDHIWLTDWAGAGSSSEMGILTQVTTWFHILRDPGFYSSSTWYFITCWETVRKCIPVWSADWELPALEINLRPVSMQHLYTGHKYTGHSLRNNNTTLRYPCVAVRTIRFSSSYSTTKTLWFQFQPLVGQFLLIHSKSCPFSQRLAVPFHLWRKRKHIPRWGRERSWKHPAKGGIPEILLLWPCLELTRTLNSDKHISKGTLFQKLLEATLENRAFCKHFHMSNDLERHSWKTQFVMHVNLSVSVKQVWRSPEWSMNQRVF